MESERALEKEGSIVSGVADRYASALFDLAREASAIDAVKADLDTLSRLLVQAPRSADLQSWLRAWLAAAPAPRGSLRVQIDIDPQSFL